MNRHKLFNEAAELRKVAYPAFPAVYEDFIKDNTISLSCGSCGSEIAHGADKLKCGHCGTKQAACAICWLDKSPYEAEGGVETTLIWTSCLRCGHSGHEACLREFWKIPESQGGCPTPGCLCDCVDGTRRVEIEQEVQKEKETSGSRVKKDEWAAGPSKAVEDAVGELSLRDKK